MFVFWSYQKNLIGTQKRVRITPATEIARNTVGTCNRRISAQTVRRRLVATRLFAWRSYNEAILTGCHHGNLLA